jgi:surfactin synthase thioesterase subunit
MTPGTQRDPWIPLRPPGPLRGTPLLCLPHAGGGAATFRDWNQDLPSSIECLAVEYPGRGARMHDEPFRRVRDLAESAAQALARWCEGRYFMFGHSVGALVAFEMARLLSRRGHPPAHLFVSGCRAPHIAPTTGAAHTLEPAALRARLASWGGAPGAIVDDPELFALFERGIRADLEAAETYLHAGPEDLGVPISAFTALEDPLAPEPAVAAWSGYTSTYFALRRMPGNHFFLKDARSLLLQTLAGELDLAARNRAQ